MPPDANLLGFLKTWTPIATMKIPVLRSKNSLVMYFFKKLVFPVFIKDIAVTSVLYVRIVIIVLTYCVKGIQWI